MRDVQPWHRQGATAPTLTLTQTLTLTPTLSLSLSLSLTLTLTLTGKGYSVLDMVKAYSAACGRDAPPRAPTLPLPLPLPLTA
jgi:hypothetical protein